MLRPTRRPSFSSWSRARQTPNSPQHRVPCDWGHHRLLVQCSWPAGRGKHRGSKLQGLLAKEAQSVCVGGGFTAGSSGWPGQGLGKSLCFHSPSPTRRPTPKPETGIFKDLLESLKLIVSPALLPAPQVSSPHPAPVSTRHRACALKGSWLRR